MVKMAKLVQEFENRSFQDEFSEKMVELTSPKSAGNYRSNQTLVAESRAVSNPRAWELDVSQKTHLAVGGASPRA
jgi:hypothetical protein